MTNRPSAWQHGRHTAQSFHHPLSRTGNVYTDESLASLTVYRSAADHHPTLCKQPFGDLVGCHAKSADIRPHKICALHRHYAHTRKPPGEKLTQCRVIAPDVCQQTVEPLPALIIGRYEGCHTERIYVAHLVDVYRPVYATTHIGIGRYDIGYLQSRSVERF